jgi:dinuclear metal center YbgI/SA1388 family protein
VHHGLFWDGASPVTGRRFRRLKALLDHDVALYGAHIPLDVHPDVGNNAVLARSLGLSHTTWFGDYRGIPLGVAGALEIPREQLVERLDQQLATRARLIPGGPPEVRRVGIITGAAGDRIHSAMEAGCDTFVTGEGGHHTYFDAMELGVNLIYAGHYATEQVGVKALGEHVAGRFGLTWAFHDHPTGL